ncbi:MULTISPECIES: C69 family dipeptidase [unclassified Acidisoma]|jgi:secernin|uniref:C69 family dipeptidase n=1 Tax=unclassified Acidisoma TaxID=2634065 RepID=UPI00131E6C15|nr:MULTISPECIES: C69 family dipeptidase [unclassified Acidisoma]
MCDTIVALPEATADGAMLLAKNADTEVNEAQQILRFPARDYLPGAAVRVTHMTIPQALHTHEIILDRSFWSWGGEIGCNEHGVAIGDEAIFTNQRAEKDGVVVLDLLRLGLERATTAREAVDVIGAHVVQFGQGGNCQMMGNYCFDSGLLIADRHEAWIVNCAGHHWAARRARATEAISNRIQIGADWDLSSLTANGTKPDFRAMFVDPAREYDSGADERESCAAGLLAARRGSITMHDMAAVLRDVGDEATYDVTEGDRSTKLCMHAGPSPQRFWHATGAMITETRADSLVVWMTGTSATDLSIFKPLFFGIPLPSVGLQPSGVDTDGTLWWRHERLHRRAMAHYREVKPEIRAEFDVLEREFHRQSETVRTGTLQEQSEFVEWCWQTAASATDTLIERLQSRTYGFAHKGYGAMWERFNAEASLAL